MAIRKIDARMVNKFSTTAATPYLYSQSGLTSDFTTWSQDNDEEALLSGEIFLDLTPNQTRMYFGNLTGITEVNLINGNSSFNTLSATTIYSGSTDLYNIFLNANSTEIIMRVGVGTGSVLRFGYGNTANGNYASATGGQNNRADEQWTTINGGLSNSAVTSTLATVGGGYGNNASGYYATIGGGYTNTASDNGGTVGGGKSNSANGQWATIAGGNENQASGDYSGILGGNNNNVTHMDSFIIGSNLISTANGTTHINKLHIADLPTSAAGLATGTVWNNSGTLMIVL